jgi:hypothetical protein
MKKLANDGAPVFVDRLRYALEPDDAVIAEAVYDGAMEECAFMDRGALQNDKPGSSYRASSLIGDKLFSCLSISREQRMVPRR